ncbi:multicomponent Na+/H+ antiporter family protein subunit B [Gracilibacillus halophilus YIM-C55.5]|uniref:Multicomponent Na+/H+ antiporter family protein subunit B n=1 Tax=Gracilibacillus halophilus YIM-C55.5 TaxID=1308866 RepID=N4WV42_9BACI|nr:Na(+)/H(+) antiporter subunit B [Gracilibacillus halophilus]ENH96966.1 multicomponent Na+/H+ antiporter family protein subunit B [Gracilibacillus halophilus YIM-C55.5]
MTRSNDLILRTMTVLIAFILFGFSIYLFFAGHNKPGGGFIGGLMTSAAIVLMYMAYGMEAINKVIPINYRVLTAIGLTIAVATGIGSFIFGEPFLSQTFDYFHFPIFGELELATALLFDLGVYLTVIGVTLTIILTISNDRS